MKISYSGQGCDVVATGTNEGEDICVHDALWALNFCTGNCDCKIVQVFNTGF